MDEGREPERIEIELTSHVPADAAGRRRVPAGADGERTEPGDVGEPGLLGTERGRLAAVGGTAAVIALLIGVVVGRMGAGGVESSDAAATTTAEATTTTDQGADRDTLPPAPATFTPPTTRPDRVTTTTAATDTLTRGLVDIDASVPRDPIDVVVMNARGEVTWIDVVSGATVTTKVEGAQFDPPTLFAGDDWILVPRFDGLGGSTVVTGDGTRSTLDLGPWWPPLAATGSDSFWRAEMNDATGQPDRFVEVAIDGSPSGVAIDFTGFYPHMVDPLGGIVVQATGGYYVLRPDSRARFTTGQLIALGEQRALVDECDEQLDCGYFVVDRTTGARMRLPLDPVAGERPRIESGGWWSIRDALSPDEAAVLVVTWDPSGSGRQTQWVLDLNTGKMTEIGSFVNSPQLAWSPDGGHVYWLDAGRLKVFDRSTGESVEFSEDLGTLNAMTLRPSVGAEPATDG